MLRIFVSKIKNPYLNLAIEEYILTQFEKKPDDLYLLFYENENATVLGKTLELSEEVYAHKKSKHLIRRMSGGGSVVHFTGNLNYCFLANLETRKELFGIHDSYEKILGAVMLKMPWGLTKKGYSDISLSTHRGFKKISGNSQVRKRGWILHHGTFLYNLSRAATIQYYLRQPKKQPDYRENRSHQEFMIQQVPIQSRAKLIRCISMGFAKQFASKMCFQSLEFIDRAKLSILIQTQFQSLKKDFSNLIISSI